MTAHFAKENITISPESKSVEKFMHTIKVLMTSNYVDNLGDEVSKGMLEKARQSTYPALVPTGYMSVA